MIALLRVVLTLLMLNQPAASQTIDLQINSEERVSVCLRQATGSSATFCQDVTGGRASIPLPSGWVFPVTIEVSMHCCISEPVIASHAGDLSVQIERHYLVHWAGWLGGESNARAEYLARNLKSWIDAGTVSAPQVFSVPSYSRAVRFTPDTPTLSPITVFPSRDDSKVRVGGLRRHNGGEVAFCIEGTRVSDVPFVVRRFSGEAIAEAKTNSQGCISIAGVPGGGAKVTSPGDAVFDPVEVLIRPGKSAWLQILTAHANGELSVLVEDAVADRRYRVEVSPQSREMQPVHGSIRREVLSGVQEVFSIPSGDYEVIVVPEFVKGVTIQRPITVLPNGAHTVLVTPSFIELSGTAKWGDELATKVPIRFSAFDGGRRLADVSTVTDDAGQYQLVLPQGGKWLITASHGDSLSWRPVTLKLDVADTSPQQLDLALPAGSVRGRVTDAETGNTVSNVSIEIASEDDASVLLTVKTDEDGSYEVRYLPPVRLRVGLSVGTAYSYGYEPSVESIDLGDSSNATVDLSLRHASSSCKMQVVSRSGDPLAGARVLAAVVPGRFPVLLGATDGAGRTSLPDHVTSETTLYVVSAGRPWSRVTRAACDREFKVIAQEPHGIVTEFQIGRGERLFSWGLIDDAGVETPLLFHLIENGLAPTPGARIRVPEIPAGVYSVWVATGPGDRSIVRRVWLPSADPIVITVD